MEAVESFGLPSRIQADHGVENLDVARDTSYHILRGQTEEALYQARVSITRELSSYGVTCMLALFTSTMKH